MNQFWLYGMNQTSDGTWYCRRASDPFTDLVAARDWYDKHIAWRGYDILHVELSAGVVYPALSFAQAERIVHQGA